MNKYFSKQVIFFLLLLGAISFYSNTTLNVFMDFEKVNLEHSDCNCLDGAAEDTSSVFARVLIGNTHINEDFYSYWDKGTKDASNGCGKICALKGISISKINDEVSKSYVIKHYTQRFNLSPKRKRGILIFKFAPNAGVVKPTPNNENIYHHDFYKADSFTLSDIIHVDVFPPITPIANV